MKMNETISFAWRILRYKKIRTLLVGIGITIATFLLTLFFAFSAGIQTNVLDPIEERLSSEVLIVSPQPEQVADTFNPLAYFRSQAKQGIARETIAEIERWPEVQKLEEEIRIPFPVATSAQIILGIGMQFDSLLSGFSEEAVREYLPEGQTFTGDEEIIPVLISPLLVEIYNTTLVEITPGAERKNLEDFLNKDMEFIFGEIYYLFFLHNFPDDVSPQHRQAKIVGFAPFLSPFTFALPEAIARDMRIIYEDIEPEQVLPRSLLITPQEPADAVIIEQKLMQMGFRVQDVSANVDTLRQLFQGASRLMIFTASMILLIALLFLATTTFMTVLEQRQSIGILTALGASHRSVQIIFLSQAIITAVVATIVGMTLALLFGTILETTMSGQIATHAIEFRDFLIFSPLLLFAMLIGICFLALLAAFFPAHKAARMQPLAAILS